MKLILAIVRDVDNDHVSHSLTSANFKVTCIASTGGFIRRGNSTLLVGTEDEKVNEALDIIRNNLTQPTEPNQKRAVIFVLKVDDYIHY
ncbi:MAG: cyclic-di-AMP receptor [Anaerolineaceae bacterium]